MNQGVTGLSYISVATFNDFVKDPPTEVYWISTIGSPHTYACFFKLDDAKEYLTKVKGQQPWEIAVVTLDDKETEK